MKFNPPTFIFLFTFIFLCLTMRADNVQFQDIRLEIMLVANPHINTNGDSHIQLSEAQAVRQLDVSDMQITSMKGIEYFTELEYLNCSHNLISSIDFSSNQKLLIVDISYNQLQHLELNLLNLKELYCQHNQLKGLNTKVLNSLKKVDCSNNYLTQLDVHQNTSLMALDCSHNKLKALNVANGNNHQINAGGFNASYNYLNCVVVDDPGYSEKKWINRIDAFSFYSKKCSVLGYAESPLSSL